MNIRNQYASSSHYFASSLILTMPFLCYQKQMIDEYIEAGIEPEDVYPQSFIPEDVFYW